MTAIPYQERAEPTDSTRIEFYDDRKVFMRLWKITRIYADGRTAGRTEWRDVKSEEN